MPRLLLIITGGVAAYKSLELIRLMKKRNVDVQVVLTHGAKEFITPLSVAALSGNRVYDDLFDLTLESDMGHIALSRAADLIAVVPATAQCLAKMALGLADDLASTLLLARHDVPVLVAPAMNVRMWEAPQTQAHVNTLMQQGVLFVGPTEGDMACGEFGYGRLADVDTIAAAIYEHLHDSCPSLPSLKNKPLNGLFAVVTAGPTQEPIDPVRYLTNHSSGKQGYALACSLRDAGCHVTLISGPVTLPLPHGVDLVRVTTAQDMANAVSDVHHIDIFVGAAAVSDWRAAHPFTRKLKKDDGGATQDISLALAPNVDILANIGLRHDGRPKCVVGFALETENLIDHAREKLIRKGADIIVGNLFSDHNRVFGSDDNHVSIVTHSDVRETGRLSKDAVAREIVQEIVRVLHENNHTP